MDLLLALISISTILRFTHSLILQQRDASMTPTVITTALAITEPHLNGILLYGGHLKHESFYFLSMLV